MYWGKLKLESSSHITIIKVTYSNSCSYSHYLFQAWISSCLPRECLQVAKAISIFWDIKPYSLVKVQRCFGGSYGAMSQKTVIFIIISWEPQTSWFANKYQLSYISCDEPHWQTSRYEQKLYKVAWKMFCAENFGNWTTSATTCKVTGSSQFIWWHFCRTALYCHLFETELTCSLNMRNSTHSLIL
jgi:hypothetical protein